MCRSVCHFNFVVAAAVSIAVAVVFGDYDSFLISVWLIWNVSNIFLVEMSTQQTASTKYITYREFDA